MYHAHTSRGFTLIEIIVAISILVAFGAVTFFSFRDMFWSSGRRVVVQEIADALRDARNNSLAAREDTVFGVHIASTSVTRFVGSTFDINSASNTIYYFEAGALATGTLVTNGTSITFRNLTGVPSATGTVIIQEAGGGSTSTITINATGLIEY